MKNLNSYRPSPTERQEELERVRAVHEDILERTRNNKEEALNYLRSVGYFQLMEDQKREQTK